MYEDALADGRIAADEDRFFVLQGDVITTESAYFFGERVTGTPLFAVLNSTCDLVPGGVSMRLCSASIPSWVTETL